MGNGDGWRGTCRICCKMLRGQNRKCPVGECWLAEVAKTRTGRFESRPFGKLEKTRSGRPSEKRFSASSLIETIRYASLVRIAAVADRRRP